MTYTKDSMCNSSPFEALGDDLARAIRRLANRDGTSLNRAAVELLRRGAGMEDGEGPDTVGSSPDHLAGRWSEPEADGFEGALRHFETIDQAVREWGCCSTRARTRNACAGGSR